MSGTESLEMSAFIVDRMEVGIFAVDSTMRVVLWNRFMATYSGQSADDMLGRNLFQMFPELPAKWLEKKIRNVFMLKNYAFTSWEQRPYLFRFSHSRPVTGGDEAMQQSCTFLPVKNRADQVRFVCVNLFDCTDIALFQRRLQGTVQELEREKEAQRRLIVKLEDAQGQLMQSEKLASIGQLAAGVAHEINNPIGFVNSNLGTLDNYVRDLLRLLDAYEEASSKAVAPPPNLEPVAALKQEVDFNFLKDDVRCLLSESKEGLERVKKIVQDLKDFARVDPTQEWLWTDLHKCLDSTLNVVSNEIKYKAQVVKHYGALPQVECMPSQLNQVFMNLLVNAAQAIVDKGVITVSTGVSDGWAWISVADTGSGIDPENIKRIFDPFFTTKPVGRGTGLGLSVSYSIVAKHGGRLEVESELGKGTTFSVHIPITQTHPDAEANAV